MDPTAIRRLRERASVRKTGGFPRECHCDDWMWFGGCGRVCGLEFADAALKVDELRREFADAARSSTSRDVKRRQLTPLHPSPHKHDTNYDLVSSQKQLSTWFALDTIHSHGHSSS